MSIKIIGFSDPEGRSAATVLCDENAPVLDQIKTFDDAKIRHIFPAGIKRVERRRDEVLDVAVFIGADIAEAIAKATESAAAAQKAAAPKVTGPPPIDAAHKKVMVAARVRNELMGRLNVAKANLRNHEITPENMRGKNWKDAVKEITALIVGDPATKVAGLQGQVNAAIDAYDAARAEEEAIAGKSITPAAKSQLV